MCDSHPRKRHRTRPRAQLPRLPRVASGRKTLALLSQAARRVSRSVALRQSLLHVVGSFQTCFVPLQPLVAIAAKAWRLQHSLLAVGADAVAACCRRATVLTAHHLSLLRKTSGQKTNRCVPPPSPAATPHKTQLPISWPRASPNGAGPVPGKRDDRTPKRVRDRTTLDRPLHK